MRTPRQKRLPEALPHQDCLRLIQAVRQPVIHTCFATMYAAGLRISEARTLQPKHVDAKQMLLTIIGKGNKERRVPITESLYKQLRQAWTEHRNQAWLFASKPVGNPISATALGNALKDAAIQAGIPHVTSHVFRHSFATRMLEAGVKIETLQILLGHADPKTTQTYLHLTEPLRKDLRQSISSFTDDIFNK